MYSFEELDVWKSAHKIRKSISILAKQFPSEEKYRLTDQIIRSSRSVTTNIEEGFGRFHFQENIQFCRHSKSSLMETLDHLICALDEKFIDEELFIPLKVEINECIHKLNSYILYLKKAKMSTVNNE